MTKEKPTPSEEDGERYSLSLEMETRIDEVGLNAGENANCVGSLCLQ